MISITLRCVDDGTGIVDIGEAIERALSSVKTDNFKVGDWEVTVKLWRR